MAVIGSLTVKLGLVTVEWDKATAKAKQEAKDLQTAFAKLGVDMTSLQNLFRNLGGAAGLSVAGFAAMSAAIFDMAGKMQDLADATGVTSAKILQFQNALVIAGGKAEDAQTIIGALFSKIASAQDGNDVAIAQFEQLGITFQELKKMSPDEALVRVYQGLSKLNDGFEKVKATKEILGKAGLGKSIDDIAKALQGSTKEFEKQAASLKKWDDMGDALAKTMFNLKIAIAELLGSFTTTKVATVEQFKAAIVAIGSAFVVGQIFNLVAAFKALNTALKGTAALSAALGTMGGGKGLAMGAAGVATYLGVLGALGGEEEQKTSNVVSGRLEGTEPKPESKEGMGGKEGGDAAAQARARLQLMKEQLKYSQLQSDLQVEFLTGNESILKMAQSIAQKEFEQARALAERDQALAKENLTLEQRGLIQDEYNLKVQKANSDDKDRRALIAAQRKQALDILYLERDQARERNTLTEKLLSLEEQRRNTNEGEFQRNKAQLALEQKLLDINQQQAKYAKENQKAATTPEYAIAMQQFAERKVVVEKEYASQIRIINEEEKIRLELLRQELDYGKKRNDLILQMAELQNKARGMNEFEARRAQESLELALKLRDIEQQRDALRTNRKDVMSAEYQAEVERLNNMEKLARDEAKIRLEGIALDEKEAMTWRGGWEAAFRDFAMNAEKYGSVARTQFDSVVGNMNSALDTFVRTGKFSFKSFAQSIIQDLIAIQLKAQAAFLLKSAMSAFGLGGGGATAKAGGGAVSQGLPYMVGENGPELFVPQSGGAIVPTARLGDSGGMGGQTINYNGPYIQSMSAIDTQTASQFLAKNKMAVWSANQSASRGLPVSR